MFLLSGAFAKVRKTTLTSVMSVRPHRTTVSGQIFIKFVILEFFEKSVEKFPVSIQSDKKNGYFTWRPIYIYDHIVLN
jgi:hypothetical protein